MSVQPSLVLRTGWRLMIPGLLLAACATVPPPATPSAPPGQVGPDANSLVAGLRSAAARRTNLRASGRVTYFGEGGRVRVGLVVVAERPGRLRIETLSPLEQPVEVLATDGQRMGWLSGPTLREGPATPENLARLIPIALYPEDLVALLLGGLPTLDEAESARIVGTGEGGRVELEVAVGAGRRASLLVDPATLRVHRWRLGGRPGLPDWEVEFDAFEAVGDVGEVARSLVVHDRRRDTEVSIKLREVEVNVVLDPALFLLRGPEGVPALPLPSPGVVVEPPTDPASAH